MFEEMYRNVIGVRMKLNILKYKDKYAVDGNVPKIFNRKQINYPKWFSFESRKLLRNKKLEIEHFERKYKS